MPRGNVPVTGGLTPLRFTPTVERPLAAGVFDGQLSAMGEHYKTFPANAYALPVGVVHVSGLIGQLKRVQLDVMVQINEDAKRALTDWANRASGGVRAAFQNLQNTGNIDDFDRQVDEAEAQTQKEAADAIHKYYDDIRNAGHQDPGAQPQLLQKAHDTGNFVSSLVNGFKTFVSDIVTKIKEWVASRSSG
jgi:hypothetical protein